MGKQVNMEIQAAKEVRHYYLAEEKGSADFLVPDLIYDRSVSQIA